MDDLAIVGLRAKPIINLTTDSRAYNDKSLISANNDLQAVAIWYSQYKNNTFYFYKRAGERFLLWCMYIKGSSLANLNKEDFEEYLNFVQTPPKSWRNSSCERGATKQSKEWRPFIKGLIGSTFNSEIRVINSLMNYLVQADYIRKNPLKLIRKYNQTILDRTEHKFSVLSRMLEEDEWALIQTTINELPETTPYAIYYKLRTQLLFAMLYLLGLRINEIATHTWGSFRKKDDAWWFFVKGKGDKLGYVPVNEQLLNIVKRYRIYLEKPIFPRINETDYIFVSRRTNKPLGHHQLYNLVKAIGKSAAATVDDPNKKQTLLKLSPHWLRHLSASHQDKLGVPATVIQANHRHSSFQTTQIYLHAEDNIRSQEMEKMKINISTTFKPIKLPDLKLQFTLKGNNIIAEQGLKMLLNLIEKHIINAYHWSSSKNKQQIMLEYANSIDKKVVLDYVFKNIDDSKLKIIKQQIEQASSVRMFVCGWNNK